MASPRSPLDELRREIDQIDTSIHDLLMRRSGVVERIAQTKGERRIYLNPSREALILRRLAARHRGAFPLPVLVRIWREMLSGFTRMQGPFAVAVHAPEERRGLWDVARDHFGSTTPMTAFSTPIQAVRAVVEGTATIAVVPWPDGDESDPWWRVLMGGDAKTPNVVARLPFIQAAEPEGSVALAVAQLPPESTGDDHTLLGIELGEPVSRSRIKEAMEGAGLAPVAFWTAAAGGSTRTLLQLVEVAEFVAPEDERLAALLARLAGAELRVRPVGGFAVPLNDPAGRKS